MNHKSGAKGKALKKKHGTLMTGLGRRKGEKNPAEHKDYMK